MPRLSARVTVVAVAVTVAAVVAAGSAIPDDAALSVWEALLLGVVEGTTEYLPVSSTGHLTVVQELLGLSKSDDLERAADAYAIAIQFGAILAVVGLYRDRLAAIVRSLLRTTGSEAPPRRLAGALATAFVPAGVSGLLLGDAIKDRLFGPWPIVAAWLVGGVVILVWERRAGTGHRDLESITVRDGLVIGSVQVIALWPGVSRSLVTILAGSARRLSTVAAVEFSFLLGLVTLGVATSYEALRSGDVIVEEFGLVAPLVGLGAALVSAAAAVAWLVRFLERRGLSIFGWYRIGLAAVVAMMLVTGVL